MNNSVKYANRNSKSLDGLALSHTSVVEKPFELPRPRLGQRQNTLPRIAVDELGLHVESLELKPTVAGCIVDLNLRNFDLKTVLWHHLHVPRVTSGWDVLNL